MSQIRVSNLTFAYEASYDNIFENTSFSIDTDWKLGFIGRNGKGKTTFLRLLLGKYDFEGSINTDMVFDFLLIDEPTNHLDKEARELVKKYLSSKKGFILVSHDRDLLDACVDHVLVLNRNSIEVQSGNFSSWWENKEKADTFAIAENEKHLKEIGKLKSAAERTTRWAQKSEATKIGFDPIKENDRCISTRSYIGAKTKKMQARVKSYETRVSREIEEKEGMLKDIEEITDLKLMPLVHHKKRLFECRDLSLKYKDGTVDVVSNLSFEIIQGGRYFLSGENGCGKSSLIKVILGAADNMEISGQINPASNLEISYISQDTSGLNGNLKDYAKKQQLDYTLLLSLLRQLDFDRTQFTKNMEDFSEGQKKKVLIAASLLTQAHLYIWDEPLNYIDVFSRMQIEKLIEKYQPTMLIVEHDVRFREKIATKVIELREK